MSKEIEGVLLSAIVYIESGNIKGGVEQIGEAIRLIENDRLKQNTKKKNMVKRSKRVD